MLSIFAIDPEVCRNLEWFRYCTEHCHPSQGRVIVDLPHGQWYENAKPIIDQLIQELNLPPVKAQSLKNCLKMVQNQLVDRPGTVWTDWYYGDFSQFSWITEIEKEHEREPFSAIVSPKYEEADDERREYHPDELNRTVKAWNTPSGIAITRSPGEFVKAILPMLRVASNIQFLDRFFTVDPTRFFIQNYKNIILDLVSHCDSFPSITIHCCPDPMPSLGYFKDELTKHYASLIPKGESVTVFLWQTNENVEGHAHPFHNRYVLTNHCGVFVGYGTDSVSKKTEAPDLLQIINHEIYLNLWNQIRDKTYPMIYVDDDHKVVIDGTKST